MKKMQIINLLLVIISMLTIFLFSSEASNNSKQTSKKVVKEVVSVVIKDESKAEKVEEKIDNNLVIVRKSAHIAEYFILGFLLLNLIKDYKKVSLKTLLFSILFCLLYAGSDEFHQIFINGRNPQLIDVGIDTLGAILGIFLYYYLFMKYKSKNIDSNNTINKI